MFMSFNVLWHTYSAITVEGGEFLAKFNLHIDESWLDQQKIPVL